MASASKLPFPSRKGNTGKQASAAMPVRHEPDHNEIALLAYIYWEERGRPEGSPEDDWYRAVATLGYSYNPQASDE